MNAQPFLVIVYAAVLIESVINTVLNIQQKNTDWRYWGALVGSIGASLLVAYNWDLDIFSVLLGEGRIPFVGAILTGFIIARGGNVVSDLIKLINSARTKLLSGVGGQAEGEADA